MHTQLHLTFDQSTVFFISFFKIYALSLSAQAGGSACKRPWIHYTTIAPGYTAIAVFRRKKAQSKAIKFRSRKNSKLKRRSSKSDPQFLLQLCIM